MIPSLSLVWQLLVWPPNKTSPLMDSYIQNCKILSRRNKSKSNAIKLGKDLLAMDWEDSEDFANDVESISSKIRLNKDHFCVTIADYHPKILLVAIPKAVMVKR